MSVTPRVNQPKVPDGVDLASAEAEIRHVFGDTPITEASIGAVNCIYSLWNDNIQSFKQEKNEASTPVFDSDWTSVSVPQTSAFTRIGRQFHALSANRYTAGINSNAITKTIANSI